MLTQRKSHSLYNAGFNIWLYKESDPSEQTACFATILQKFSCTTFSQSKYKSRVICDTCKKYAKI